MRYLLHVLLIVWLFELLSYANIGYRQPLHASLTLQILYAWFTGLNCLVMIEFELLSYAWLNIVSYMNLYIYIYILFLLLIWDCCGPLKCLGMWTHIPLRTCYTCSWTAYEFSYRFGSIHMESRDHPFYLGSCVHILWF